MAETPEKEPQAETLNKETQLDKEPVALNGRSSRMPAIVVSSLALAVISAAAIYALPKFNIALPNFISFAELFPRETASAPLPDPAASATDRRFPGKILFHGQAGILRPRGRCIPGG